MKDLKSKKELDFIVTSDFYRVDMGIILRRHPVIWNIKQKELEEKRHQLQFDITNDYYVALDKSLLEFDVN